MKRTAPDPNCPDCGGTGEVTTMERVYPGEPHMAPIGTAPCHCTTPHEEEYDDQESDEETEDDDDPLGSTTGEFDDGENQGE